MLVNSENNHKLLIVDDEPDIVKVMQLGLQQAGYEVDAFTDPKTALDHYRRDYYARIISDIRMPSMTGFEFARQIWAKDPKAQVCFLSSFEIHEGEARKVFSDLKSYCFVKKPIKPSALAQHVKAHAQIP